MPLHPHNIVDNLCSAFPRLQQLECADCFGALNLESIYDGDESLYLIALKLFKNLLNRAIFISPFFINKPDSLECFFSTSIDIVLQL